MTRFNARVDQERWVSALFMGPGFFVYDGDSASYHPYLEKAEFAQMGAAGGLGATGFGARWVVVVQDEIFMLEGEQEGAMRTALGNPNLIDVYGLDGEYRRSYKLPNWTLGFDTDGTTFYILRYEPMPALLGIRPD